MDRLTPQFREINDDVRVQLLTQREGRRRWFIYCQRPVPLVCNRCFGSHVHLMGFVVLSTFFVSSIPKAFRQNTPGEDPTEVGREGRSWYPPINSVNPDTEVCLHRCHETPYPKENLRRRLPQLPYLREDKEFESKDIYSRP